MDTTIRRISMVQQNSKLCIESKKIQFCWEKAMQTGVAKKLIENQPLLFVQFLPVQWCSLIASDIARHNRALKL